jgi:hypothetical protein
MSRNYTPLSSSATAPVEQTVCSLAPVLYEAGLLVAELLWSSSVQSTAGSQVVPCTSAPKKLNDLA